MSFVKRGNLKRSKLATGRPVNETNYIGGGFSYNIATNKVNQLFPGSYLKFDSLHNQCAQIRPGLVAAMIRRQRGSNMGDEVCIGTYTKGGRGMRIVDSLGVVYLNFKFAAQAMAYQNRKESVRN